MLIRFRQHTTTMPFSSANRKQRGVASIEFAFFFVIFFMLFYGIAGYTLPLMMSASYQQLASEVLRDALIWKNQTHDSNEGLETHVAAQIDAAWMPAGWAQTCAGQAGYLAIDEANGEWSVCLRHPNPAEIIPPLTLLGFQIPKLPEQIVGFASIHTWESSTP